MVAATCSRFSEPNLFSSDSTNAVHRVITFGRARHVEVVGFGEGHSYNYAKLCPGVEPGIWIDGHELWGQHM